MEKALQIIPMDRSMLPACVDLFIDTFTKEPWNDVYESREQVVTFFENYMNDNYFIGYVVKDKEEIVALSMGAKKPWIHGMEYYIDQFCVSESHQGTGVGSRLMEYIEADIKSKGMDGMILTTDRGFPSEKFYIKQGFKAMNEIIFLAK